MANITFAEEDGPTVTTTLLNDQLIALRIAWVNEKVSGMVAQPGASLPGACTVRWGRSDEGSTDVGTARGDAHWPACGRRGCGSGVMRRRAGVGRGSGSRSLGGMVCSAGCRCWSGS